MVISDKSPLVVGDISEINTNEFNNNVTFHGVDEYVIYKISLKNNLDKDITIISIDDDNESEHIIYEYDKLENKKISLGKTFDLNVKVIYKNELSDISNRIQPSKVKFTISYLENGEIKEGNVVINPGTGDNITFSVILLFVSSMGFAVCILLDKKKSKKKIKTYVLVLSLIFTPIAVDALNSTYDFTINSNYELYDKVLVTYVVDNVENSLTIPYSSILTGLENPSKAGYTFNNWKFDDGSTFDITKPITSDIKINADFTLDEYNISYDLNDGIVAQENRNSYTINTETFTITNPVKEGYAFKGLSGTNLDGDRNTVLQVKKGSTGNLSFNANYVPNTYVVKFDSNMSDVSGSMDDQVFTYDESQTLSELNYSKKYYKFVGWNTKSDGSGDMYDDQESILNLLTEGEITLYAQWIYSGLETVFSFDGQCTFNGNNHITGSECSEYWDTNYIDTGVALFSDEYYDQDFEVGFTIDAFDPNNQDNIDNLVFASDKNESGDNSGKAVPGFVVRINASNKKQINISHVSNGSKKEYNINSNLVQKVKIYRINGIMYYSLNDGEMLLLNNNVKTTEKFDVNLSFGGAIQNNGTPYRFIKATLSNMYVKVGKVNYNDYYNIRFDGNGGCILVTSKVVKKNSSIYEFPSASRSKYYLAGWTTEKNGDVFIDSNYVPTSDATYYASWKYAVDAINLEESDFVLDVGDSKQIVITNPELIEEDYSFSTAKASIATVDSNGLVTATGSGTTKIYIRGKNSNKTKQINVVVN